MGGRRALEAEFAARWAAGEWRGWRLRTEHGEEYQLVFQGRRGGPAGPDFLDAVLERANGTRIRGDVELHLRPNGWYAHAHATDPRYNDVVLHVTPGVGSQRHVAVQLASGRTAPQAALERALPPAAVESAPRWPCEGLRGHIGPAAVRTLLRDAGAMRFNLHARRFREELAGAGCAFLADRAGSDAAARVLTAALAEALGYGRDRAALRSAGERLAAGKTPPALQNAGQSWPHVERKRLAGLLKLWERWGQRGPWALLGPLEDALPTRVAASRLIEMLVVRPGFVSRGRAAILVANVVLPFAAAWASLTGDSALDRAAREVYAALPGLPSNQITREMVRQLGLPRLPEGAAAQQGLQHLWSVHCRDKHCSVCPCNAAPANAR